MIREKAFGGFKRIIRKGWLNWMPTPSYLKLYYRLALGKKLDLRNPRTFNERLQWLKIYEQNPLYTTMVDKYDVKNYVSERIGNEYIIPTLGVWNRAEDIDFDTLPDKFVLKATHDSGGIKIIDKKKGYNKKEVVSFFNQRLKRSLYDLTREWPYKNVKPRIIAETYMVDNSTEELRDYKFYCFDGRVKLLMITSNRMSKAQTYFDYFDRTYKHLPIMWGKPNSKELPSKPKTFDEMIRIAEILSKDLPHVRVDLYECNCKVYFGEMTFFDGSGFTQIEPQDWDYKLGEWIHLPERK